jgi:hypothetical protein
MCEDIDNHLQECSQPFLRMLTTIYEDAVYHLCKCISELLMTISKKAYNQLRKC